MSNALSLLSRSSANLPAHLRAAQQSSDWDGIGGISVPRIEVADRRIKAILNGTEIASSRDPIEVVLVKPGPVGRVFYESEYVKGEKMKPDCYSNDGISPAADAQAPQAMTCDSCPQNIKGSSKTMGGAKACRYRQNVAVWLPGEKTRDKLFRISLPATAIFPDEENGDGYRPLNKYVKELRAISATPSMVWTKVAIDADADQPRLLFKVVDWVDDPQDFAQVEALATSPEMEAILNTGPEHGDAPESSTASALGPRPTGLNAQAPAQTAAPASTRRSRSAPSYPTTWPAGVAETDFDDQVETYWFHQASDTYFAVPPGELLPDEKVCEELTREIFESDLAVQAEEIREAEEKRRAEEEEKRRAEEARRVAEEARRVAEEEEARRRAQEEAEAAARTSTRRRRGDAAPEPEPEAPATSRRRRGEAAPEPEAAPASTRRRAAPAAEPAAEPEAPATTRRRAEPAKAEPAKAEPAKAETGKTTLSSRRRQPVPQDAAPETKPAAKPAATEEVAPPARAANAAPADDASEAPASRENANLSVLESLILSENATD